MLAGLAVARVANEVPGERRARDGTPNWAAALTEGGAPLFGDTYILPAGLDAPGHFRRWQPADREPVRVWIDPRRALDRHGPRFTALVRGAFAEWSRTGTGLRFAFVADSADAEIRVAWVRALPHDWAGMTIWSASEQGVLRRGDITISLRTSDGVPRARSLIRATALHEIGHALGLGHSPRASDIMAPIVEVRSLSERDRASIRLLYLLPLASGEAPSWRQRLSGALRLGR